MKRRIVLGTLGLLVASSGLGAFALASGKATRADCPGKIVCPLTGELVCRDQCPQVDSNRPDCPGQVECPLTGELVCRDQCPAQSTDQEKDLPPCCRGGAGKN